MHCTEITDKYNFGCRLKLKFSLNDINENKKKIILLKFDNK